VSQNFHFPIFAQPIEFTIGGMDWNGMEFGMKTFKSELCGKEQRVTN
jgi:hypothetical protein